MHWLKDCTGAPSELKGKAHREVLDAGGEGYELLKIVGRYKR